MDNTEKKIESVEREVQYFQKMVEGAEKIVRPWRIAVLALIIGWFLTIVGFLIYLNLYDFTSSVEATGVYTAVDRSGNIVAKDLTDEQFNMFMEWLNNGEDKEN